MKTQLFLHLLSLICCEGRGEGGDAGSWRGCLAENVEIPMDEEVEGVAGETLSREGDTFEVSKGEKEVDQEVHVEDASRGIEDFFRHALHGDTALEQVCCLYKWHVHNHYCSMQCSHLMA